MVIIVRGRDGKRDGLYARQGGLMGGMSLMMRRRRMILGGCVGGPFIATGPLSVCCEGLVPPRNSSSIVWGENTLAAQCWERLLPVPSGSGRFLVWRVSSCARVDDDWRFGVVCFGPPCKNGGLVDQRRSTPFC